MVDDETEATAVPALTIEDIFELLKKKQAYLFVLDNN
jgi:hypothetical protein